MCDAYIYAFVRSAVVIHALIARNAKVLMKTFVPSVSYYLKREIISIAYLIMHIHHHKMCSMPVPHRKWRSQCDRMCDTSVTSISLLITWLKIKEQQIKSP